MSDKIKVAIKVRRLIDREESEGLVSQWEVNNNSIFQKDISGKYRELYSFDHVFDSETSNYEVFNTIARPIIDSSVSGFNGTIFAYGQTSSGKTYTMIGNQHEPGIIPQTIQYIFEAVNKVEGREFLLRASYIEIYNEKVNDLLEKGKTGLKLREVEGTTIICGVKEEVVHTPDKIMQLMKRGENIRHIGETNMNERSSRSHTIFRIIIESRVPNEGEDGVIQVSHLNLVDLAGSERLDQTGSKGDRLKEGCCINRSLFMLSHVISQLSEGQDQYVNFRDSKLTRILQSSLGGNAHTAIICAVTPASIEETSSTLGFASRAINVKNKPHINEVLSDAALLKRYARQIAKLQTELEKTKNRNKIYEVEEIESKLQEEQRRNELLQERIDLMKEQLIGCAATESVAVDKRRALRRRTWCGHASRKSLFSITPSLQTIDENSAHFFGQECLSTAIQELANNTLFETPLEEFELQLMDAERRLSPDSLETPCNITFRKDKRRHVTFDDESESTENQSKKTVEIGSQTETLPLNFNIMNTEYETPPHILRERIMYFQKEYDELREFTTLEKQICNPVCYKEATGLEMQNRQLQKSVSDLENVVLNMDCTNGKLRDENKSLKDRLVKETEKCNGMVCRLQPLETALSQVSQEVVDLTKQLNVAAQRIKELENERNDYEMAREWAETRLKARNKELILSLEDAKVKLKELTHNAEDLTRKSASNFDLNKLQDELIILREENVSLLQELKQKNELLEQLRQKNDELKENDLSICLKNMKEELISLQRSNFLSTEQLKIKDEILEKHIKQTEELKSEKEQILKYIEKCHKQMKQQNKKFTNIDTCMIDVNKAQEQENLMKEANVMCSLEVWDQANFSEILKQSSENLCAVQEPNVKYIEHLQEKEECHEHLQHPCKEVKEGGPKSQELSYVYDELKALTEINFVCIEKLREKHEYFETLKHQIEEADLKYIDKLQKKDTYLEQLKEQIEDLKERALNTQELCREKVLNSATENGLMGTEVKAKNEYLEMLETVTGHNTELIFAEEGIKILKDQGMWYDQGLTEKDTHCEILKKHSEHWGSVEIASSKYIDELKEKIENMQKEITVLKEEKSLTIKAIKEKDSYLETLKKQIQNLDSTIEANSKYIDEMKTDNITVQKENDSLGEKHSLYREQLRQKDNCLEIMKQQIEELTAEREANLTCIEVLKANTVSLQTEILSLQENNSLYMGLVKERNDCLETLKQQIEDLNCAREKNLKYIDELRCNSECLQKEIICVEEKNSVYMDQLKEEDDHLEALKHKVEDLNCERETNLQHIDELKANNECLQKEVLSSEEKNSVYMEQLKENDNYLESLKREIQDLNYARETNLKDIDELKANNGCLQKEIVSLERKNSVYIETLKQQIEDLNCARETNLKYIDELRCNNECLQKEIISLEEKNSVYMDQLKEEDNHLEALKHEVEDLNCERETNLQHIDELKANNECLQKEVVSSEEKNSVYMEQLKEKDNYLEALKREIQDLNCSREINLKDNDELKANNECLQKEIFSLEEKNSVYIEQLKEKDNHLETLKQETEHLISEREENLKDIDELKTNIVNLQSEINSLQEYNIMHMRQVREKDNCLETLKKQLEELDCHREANLTSIDELKANIVNLQKEVLSLEEKYSMFSEEVKGKDNYLQRLKNHVEDMNSGREKNLKYIDELESNNASLQMQIHSLAERNSVYMEQVKEKDKCLETLKQETEDLNCAREANLKYIDDLRSNNEHLQKEIISLEEKNSVYMEQLKEKDNYLEALKHEVEDLNCMRETNLKHIDELKANNECLKKEIISLEEKSSVYMEQLKEKDNGLETVQQEFEGIAYARETNLECGDELQFNIRLGKEVNSINAENAMYREQLKEKDIYIEALKQQIEDVNSLSKANLKCTEQVHEKNKCCDSLKYEKEPESQEYVVLAEEVECCNTHVPSELSEMTRILSVKSDEIELCQRMMLKEVSHLKPDYDMGSLSQSQPTDLLKMLLALVMEKEKEVFLSLQDEMNEIRSQANEAEEEYANKDKQKDCWIRELETEIEHLQAHVARAEEEKKALEMADKSHCLALLEQERADLMKKFGKMDSDLVVIRQERDHVDSHNKEMARKLEDVQLLLEKKSSQLQEEMENQFSKSPKLETLMKEISDLGENNAVLRERLEKTDNDNNLLLKKVEDLQCALMLKNNENLDMVRKLDSLERELKVLSMKNCALEEEIIANKEVHSLLLKEKDHWSQITLNLKKVTEDVENLRVKELVWDSEKEQLQTQLAAKQNELSLERDIRWRLENDMKTNIQKVEEEKDQLQVSYSHLLQNYETLKGEDKHSHQMKQVQSLNVSDCMSQKSEITVAEPDENLVLKKQLEEELEKQKELSRKCENLATCITGLKEEVNRLCNENVSLRESLKILSAEENRLNALMHTKESELESFKRQLEKSVHGKAASVLAFQCIKEPTQQREKALGCKNKDYSSSLSANGSCTESLHSRQQFSVRVAHRMAEECGTAISEERKLKEQLKICMEENMALSNKNEQLATDTHGLQKMLERYRVDNNALEKSLEILEEEKKGLLSQLSDTRKRLFNVESEVRELKLKIVAMRKDEASQDNIVLRFRVKELEAEVERLQIRKKSLLREGQSVGHNISKRHALYCQVQSQLAETTSVLKSSVATNTDISGSCQCKELTEKVRELKLSNAQQNNMIGNLKLQIRAEEFPYQQKVKELEERVSFYKSQNMDLRTEVRRLNNTIKESGCDHSRKPMLLQPKHVSVQTDEVKDEEEFLFAGAGGSGIIREDQLMKMRIKIRDLETKTEMLKELCRARRKKILDLEEKLNTALGSKNMKEEENCDSGESKGITKQFSGAGSSRGLGLIQYNKGFGSDYGCCQTGNKENFPGRAEALQRPGRNKHEKLDMHDVRRPLNENFPSTEDVNVPVSD